MDMRKFPCRIRHVTQLLRNRRVTVSRKLLLEFSTVREAKRCYYSNRLYVKLNLHTFLLSEIRTNLHEFQFVCGLVLV